MIGWLDAMLRAREGIFEFSDDPQCLFRIGLRRAERNIELNDGGIIEAGDRFIELHFWNEHLGEVPHKPGADLAWGKTMQRRIARSLKLLARYLETREDLRDIPAIYGRWAMAGRGPKQIRQIIQHFGFESDRRSEPGRLLQRIHDRGEDMLIRSLSWAFSPFGRQLGKGALPRHEIWMSRRALLERYGSGLTHELAASVPGHSRRARRARAFGRDASERRIRRADALTPAQSEDSVGR